METITLVGYHATTLEKSKQILKEGFQISKTTKDNLEWLGNGVYFWEDDYYAVQWNVIDIEKHNKNKNEQNLKYYSILKSIIKVNEIKIFEISSPEGSIVFNELKNKLVDKFIQEGYEEWVKELLKRSSKFWINLLEENGFFDDFDVITAVYKNEKNFEKYKDDIVFNTQKQICVKNKACIIDTTVYDDQERILNLFAIIKKKRGEKNEKGKKVIKESK